MDICRDYLIILFSLLWISACSVDRSYTKNGVVISEREILLHFAGTLEQEYHKLDPNYKSQQLPYGHP